MPIARNGIESNRIYRTDDENSNHASSTVPQAQASTGQFGIQQRQRQRHTLSFNQQLQPILDTRQHQTYYLISLSSGSLSFFNFWKCTFQSKQYIDMNMPVASNSMMDDATYLSHNSINDAPSDVSHLSNS
jgi:hypothetical protein